MSYYNNFSSPDIQALPQEVAKTTVRATKQVLKMFPTIFQLLLGYLVLDYFVYLWDNSTFFTSWRNNVEAEKVRRTVDTWFADDQTQLGRYLVVALVYGTATYLTTIKYGKSLWTLAGPVSVFAFVTIIQLILRFLNKYNGDINPNGSYCSDNSLGCSSWRWVSSLTDVTLGYYSYSDSVNNIIIGIVAGFFIGYARSY
jgi:hypothetical protein